MADLVTHLCSALLPAAFVRHRIVGSVVLGTILPDVVSRVPPLALDQLDQRGIVAIPEELMFPWGVLHEPVGLFLVGVLACLAIVERDRSTFLRGVWLGCALHVGLDVLQDHHGQGYFLLAPFVIERFELGWIGSEATVPVAGPLAGLTAVAWLVRWAIDRRRGRAAATTDGGR